MGSTQLQACLGKIVELSMHVSCKNGPGKSTLILISGQKKIIIEVLKYSGHGSCFEVKPSSQIMLLRLSWAPDAFRSI